MIKALIFGCLLLLSSCSNLIAQTIPNMRDGVVYLRKGDLMKDEVVTVKLAWSNAWIADSQEDHVFLQAPNGDLLKTVKVNSATKNNSAIFKLNEPGDYRVEVAGASFRNFTLSTHSALPMVFEPAKIHKSIALPRSGRMFFSVRAHQQASFSAKRYGNLSDFTLSSVTDDRRYQLKLKKHRHYWEHDTAVIPQSIRDEIYQVSWSGDGKVSFWLDGVPNLFSTKKSGLFEPHLSEGKASIQITDTIVGPVPSVGAAFPFVNPPEVTWPAIRSWNVEAANYYFFADDLKDNKHRDIAFLETYEQQLGIRKSNSILANTGRDSVLKPTKDHRSLIIDYLESRHKRGLLNDNYVAFADEPNLNYSSYDEFETYFGYLAAAIKNSDNPYVAQTKLAVPQSSRFLQGPTRDGAADRKGIVWAEKLIQQYGQWIDGISWHEWLVRDLIDTPRYHEAVVQANLLARKYQDRLGKDPALIIGQTNVSSGASLSPYEQETFFAALWWTSVVIQSSQAGKLDQIMWFKAADDPIYKKGMIRVNAKGVEHKPVSHAMHFITENMLPWVLEIKNKHPELDMLATLSKDKKRVSLLGVNKGKRAIKMNAVLPFLEGKIKLSKVTGLNEQGETDLSLRLTRLDEGNRQLGGLIPQETLFSVTLTVQSQ